MVRIGVSIGAAWCWWKRLLVCIFSSYLMFECYAVKIDTILHSRQDFRNCQLTSKYCILAIILSRNAMQYQEVLLSCYISYDNLVGARQKLRCHLQSAKFYRAFASCCDCVFERRTNWPLPTTSLPRTLFSKKRRLRLQRQEEKVDISDNCKFAE